MTKTPRTVVYRSRLQRRPHPMELITITCELREDADVYGWEGPLTVCEYCEDPSRTAICAQCRADLEIPATVVA